MRFAMTGNNMLPMWKNKKLPDFMKNTFKNKMVQVGEEANTRKEIRNGLQPGDLVVITGAYLLNSEYIFKKGTNPMEGMKM